jgi:hypothetical protein
MIWSELTSAPAKHNTRAAFLSPVTAPSSRGGRQLAFTIPDSGSSCFNQYLAHAGRHREGVYGASPFMIDTSAG